MYKLPKEKDYRSIQ